LGTASGSALVVDHRRLDRLSPMQIWLVSRVISVDTEITEEFAGEGPSK
jgi:hypothetical protein